MQLQDALFNWLQIQIVWEARPNDRSAKDTVEFFQNLLIEDHEVTNVEMQLLQGEYQIKYLYKGKEQGASFPIELAEKLLKDITEEPRYNQCF